MEPNTENDSRKKQHYPILDTDHHDTPVDSSTSNGLLQVDTTEHSQQAGSEKGVTTSCVGFEAVLDSLGKPGRFQMLQIALIKTCVIPYVLILVNSVFTNYEPPHECSHLNKSEFLSNHLVPNASSVNLHYESCQSRVIANLSGEAIEVFSIGCSGHREYRGGKHVSMVTEWDLTCESKSLAGIAQITVMIGVSFGSIISTPLADRYGRKKVLAISNLLTIASEIGVAFSPNIYAVFFLRFFSGMFGVGTGLIAFVLGGELLVSRHRQIYGSVRSLVWSFGIMTLAGVSYLLRFRSWRLLQMITGLSGLIPLLCLFFVYESPTWLLAKHRYEGVYAITKKACLFNGKKLEEVKRIFDACVAHTEECTKNIRVSNTNKSKNIYNVIDIFRNPTLCKITFVLGVTWFTCNISYFGLYFTSWTLPGNRYLVFFIMAATEVPSCLITPVVIQFTGRRAAILILLASSAVCLLVSACLVSVQGHSDGSKTIQDASVAFYILGKFTTSSCYIALIVFTLELYPTTLRTSGSGICVVCSTIGGVVAPFLAPLFTMAPWAPGTVLASLNLLTFFLIPLLPETRGRQLPNSVNDIDGWKQEQVADI